MLGYIVKPIEKYNLRTAIQLAIKNAYLESLQKKTGVAPDEHFLSKRYLFIKKKRAYHKVAIASIAYIQSDDNYCIICMNNKDRFIARVNMSELEELLPPGKFMRTHRSYIVGLDKVDSIDFQDSTLTVMGVEIPVSRRRRKELEMVTRRLG